MVVITAIKAVYCQILVPILKFKWRHSYVFTCVDKNSCHSTIIYLRNRNAITYCTWSRWDSMALEWPLESSPLSVDLFKICFQISPTLLQMSHRQGPKWDTTPSFKQNVIRWFQIIAHLWAHAFQRSCAHLDFLISYTGGANRYLNFISYITKPCSFMILHKPFPYRKYFAELETILCTGNT